MADLFAGAGGFSEGARLAGLHVVASVNHWRIACDTHDANFPHMTAMCQDAALMDPRDLPAFDGLLASPACQGHSPARGKDRPHHDAARATAWCVVNTVEVTRPRWFVVENVPAFLTWALYRPWAEALRLLGYSLSENILNAAEFGVPQDRSRVYIVGMRGKSARWLTSPRLEHQPAESILDAGGVWSDVRKAGRATQTLSRIESGRRRFGRRFLIPYYKSGSGLTGRSVARPLGTVTTKDRYALVDGDKMRMLTVAEYRRAMGFREDYIVTGTRVEQVKQYGNAVCPPVAAHILREVA
ncbi:MAG: DNA cytosine methyltransferase [Acidobacteria bacterium]|nr:DNA cytosine methyltransferase [Acidobacteriota bacterium]